MDGFRIIGSSNGHGRGSQFSNIESKLIISKHFANKKAGTYSLSFYFGHVLLKRLGWEIGLFVQFLYDDENRLGFFRKVPQGTAQCYKITRNTVTSQRGRITITWNSDYPSVEGAREAENVIVKDEGLLFEWPRRNI